MRIPRAGREAATAGDGGDGVRVGRWLVFVWWPEITFGWCWSWLPRVRHWPDLPGLPVICDSFQWGPFEVRRMRK